MKFHRNKILLLSNLAAGSFLLFLVGRTGRWLEPIWFGAVRELLTIPCLLTLMVVTVISFVEVRKNEFNWRSGLFLSLVFGVLVILILILSSLSIL